VTIAQRELDARNTTPPTGSAGVRKLGSSFQLEWSGSRRDVELAPTSELDIAKLKIKDTDAHRFFVKLHKAKGATAFKWFAAVLGVLSFVVLAWIS